MHQPLPDRDPIGPLDWLKRVPFKPVASSVGLGWTGLEATRFRGAPSSELYQPGITHHRLSLITRPPERLDLRYEGVRLSAAPAAGSLLLLPAGSAARWQWTGPKDTLNLYLSPGLVERVAAEAFDLDPARLEVPPLGGLDLPPLRAAVSAVDAELSAGGIGGPLAAEALANVLVVHLIRHVLAPRPPERGRDGALPRHRLRAVVEYVEAHLDSSPTLEDMAAVAHLSAYHFARQFKRATGLPPHQYVIARRVERAKQLLQRGREELSLAEVAAHAGFSDQSQFSHHFKRLVGVTPGQFRMPARIAERAANTAKMRPGAAPTMLESAEARNRSPGRKPRGFPRNRPHRRGVDIPPAFTSEKFVMHATEPKKTATPDNDATRNGAPDVFVMNDFHRLIDGELVDGAATLDVINPATGRAFAEAPRADRASATGP